MGNNPSKNDDTVAELEKTDNRATSAQASTMQRTTEMKASGLEDTLPAATVRSPMNARLPPIESREAVRLKASRFESWTLVDPEEELQICYMHNEKSGGDGLAIALKDSNPEPRSLSPKTSLTTSDLPHLPPVPDYSETPTRKRVLTEDNLPSGKRRLIMTRTAADLLSIDLGNGSHSLVSLLDKDRSSETEIKSHLNDTENFLPSNGTYTGIHAYTITDTTSSQKKQDTTRDAKRSSEDEGYNSFTTSLSASTTRQQSLETEEADLVQYLAAVQRTNVKPSNTTQTCFSDDDTGLSNELQGVVRQTADAQEEAARRSRLLREAAVNRQMHIDLCDSSEESDLDREESQLREQAESDSSHDSNDERAAKQHNPEVLSSVETISTSQRPKDTVQYPSGLQMLALKRGIPDFGSVTDHRDATHFPSSGARDNFTESARHFDHGAPANESVRMSTQSSPKCTTLVDDGEVSSQKLSSPWKDAYFSTETPPAKGSSELDNFEILEEHGPDNHGSRVTARSCVGTVEPISEIAREDAELHLPRNFHKLSQERQEVIKTHEILKETKRDLEIALGAAESIAQLRCFGVFTNTDNKEFGEVKKYIDLVIRRKLSGKLRRSRIMSIRDNMKRRARATGRTMPDKELVEKNLLLMFDHEDLRGAEIELTSLEDQITVLSDKRKDGSRQQKNVRRSQATRAGQRGREQTKMESTRGEPRTTAASRSKTHKESRSAVESHRKVQFLTTDQKREMLEAQLQRFKSLDIHASQHENECDSFDRLNNQDDGSSNSDESEEDEGAERVFGSHIQPTNSNLLVKPESASNDNKSIGQRTGRKHQQQDHPLPKSTTSQPLVTPEALNSHAHVQSSQAIDMRLIERMQAKAEARKAEDLGRRDEQIAAEAPLDADTDDEDDEDSNSDEDHQGPRQLFQYTVYGVFAGAEDFDSGDEYEFFKTQDIKRANRKVAKLASEFETRHPPENGLRLGRRTVNSEWENGLLQQHLSLGEENAFEARFFVIKKPVNVNKRAYRRAKRRNLVVNNIVYKVEWELIREFEQEQAQTPEPVDELFDDVEPTETIWGPPIHLIIPVQDVKSYTTSAQANRAAADIWLPWYFKFFPGLDNEHQRRLDAEEVEKELERQGDFGLWAKEDTFYGKEIRQQQQDQHSPAVHAEEDTISELEVGGEVAEPPTTTTTTTTVKVRETFKVWVRKDHVYGPPN